MIIKPKYSIDNPPDVFEKRVFIGGNYQSGATIQDIADIVEDCEYQPIIPWEFGITPGIERHSSKKIQQILKQCRYAILEVSTTVGYFPEMDDAERFSTICMCLWDDHIEVITGHPISPEVANHSVFAYSKPYHKVDILQYEVRKFLEIQTGMRAYIDTNIISRIRDGRCSAGELEAIAGITEHKELLFTSNKTQRELQQYQNPSGMVQLRAIYNLFINIPEQNLVKLFPAVFDGVSFNEAIFGGSAPREDPLFSGLKEVFDVDDAEHIFQAVKNGMDFFVTLDKSTILDRANEMKDKLTEMGVKLRFVLPTELLEEIKNTFGPE